MELGDYQAYARLSHCGERLPAFWLHLDPPPVVYALLFSHPTAPERIAAVRATMGR